MTAQEAMQWFLAHPEDFQQCVLCGLPPTYIGMFAINIKNQPTKQRMFGYAICEDCKQEPDHPKYVEKVVLSKHNS